MIVILQYLFVLGASIDPGPLVWPPGDMLAERRQGAIVLRLQPLSVQDIKDIKTLLNLASHTNIT